MTRIEAFISAAPMVVVGTLALLAWARAAWRERRRPNRYVREVLPPHRGRAARLSG